jgi:MFS transporter, putative metabolite:H+ symporter
MEHQDQKITIPKSAYLIIIVSALGFFVDIYDMMIFSAVKEKSYISLGLAKETINNGQTINNWSTYTVSILNMQMFGMLIGGFIWGYIGDKFGRLKVLFGSILIYSLFTFLNIYVADISQYKWCRFFAGIGLAGELGAGITLVTEQVPKKYRGFAVAFVGSIGMLGAVFAGFIANTNLSWQNTYIIGAAMGIVLLLLRLGVLESGLYKNMQNSQIKKGSFLLILKNKKLLYKFICILLVGLPGWYATGILITHTSAIAESLGMAKGNLPNTAKVMSINFLGFACGDILCGLLSQKLKSRKKAIASFLSLYAIFVLLYFTIGTTSITIYYLLFAGMGVSVGFSIMLFTLAAEQFGTNIRTLVSSTSLNLVRAWVIPLGIAFTYFASSFGNSYAKSAMLLGAICITFAFAALSQLEETFSKDLDYYEH